MGKPRSKCVISKVKELNETVKVSVHEGALTEDVVKNHDCVVMINQPRKDCVRFIIFSFIITLFIIIVLHQELFFIIIFK